MIEIYNEMLNSIADEIGKDYIDTYREELLNFVGTESFNYSGSIINVGVENNLP